MTDIRSAFVNHHSSRAQVTAVATVLAFALMGASALSFDDAAAASKRPAGSVKLTGSLQKSVGKVRCGKIRGAWLPGTKLAGSYFVAHGQQYKNFNSSATKAKKAAKKAKGNKAKRYRKLASSYLKSAKTYSSKAKTQLSACKQTREPTRVAKSFAKGIASDELLGWLEAAVGEMVDPPTDFMGLLWPVGSALDDEPDPSAFDGAPFREHAAVLDDSEIDEVAAFFADWQSGLQGCEPEETRGFDEGAQRVERWIRGGANVATAPDPCLKSRSAVLAWTDNQDKETVRHIFFHEAYHGLSNYLLRQCAPILNRAEDSMDHLRWFAEGTADYFSLFMQSQQDGRDDYEQRILERAQLELQGDPGMTMASNTYVQTAGILLLIKRGLVSHEKVIDGSYFTNCDWIETFDPSQPEVKFAFDNFGQIESVDGEFAYPDEVING